VCDGPAHTSLAYFSLSHRRRTGSVLPTPSRLGGSVLGTRNTHMRGCIGSPSTSGRPAGPPVTERPAPSPAQPARLFVRHRGPASPMASITPSGGGNGSGSTPSGSNPNKGARSRSPSRPEGSTPVGARHSAAPPSRHAAPSRPTALTRPSLVVVGGNAEGSLHWRDQMVGSLDAEAGEIFGRAVAGRGAQFPKSFPPPFFSFLFGGAPGARLNLPLPLIIIFHSPFSLTFHSSPRPRPPLARPPEGRRRHGKRWRRWR